MSATPLVSLRDSSKVALDAAELAVTTRAKQAVRPIYVNDGNDPDQEGSCTFLTVDKQDYLVTCAHVIDVSSKETTLFVGQGKLHGITAHFSVTKSPTGKRDDDYIDFAFAPVDDTWRKMGIVPLTETEMKHPKAHFYCAYGYPNSSNGKKSINFHGHKITPTARSFISIPVTDPAVLNAAGINEHQHLPLFRDPKGYNGDVPFEPKGMSGGAIFAMHDLSNVEMLAGLKPARISAAALITHKNKAQKLLVGTSLSVIVETIRTGAQKAA